MKSKQMSAKHLINLTSHLHIHCYYLLSMCKFFLITLKHTILSSVDSTLGKKIKFALI